MTVTTAPADEAPVLKKLSTPDRFLPVWIIAAMAIGIGLGRLVPGLSNGLNAVTMGSVSLPIAIGLLVALVYVALWLRSRLFPTENLASGTVVATAHRSGRACQTSPACCSSASRTVESRRWPQVCSVKPSATR